MEKYIVRSGRKKERKEGNHVIILTTRIKNPEK